jgi:hypothetical protein
MAKAKSSFRIGRVQAYLRGKIWYLCYHENGARRRPRERHVGGKSSSKVVLSRKTQAAHSIRLVRFDMSLVPTLTVKKVQEALQAKAKRSR